MQYIVHRRFRHTSVCDSVNIPAMSECESVGNVIYYNGKQICSATIHGFGIMIFIMPILMYYGILQI